jgi:aryl-alcohol dehydrogenase-like predicted oxidoreductase
MLPVRSLGNTGIYVTVLGLGAGQTGDHSVPEKEIELLLNSALDLGINLIDTARGYGASEERIGKYLSHRRSEFVLSTKVGYGIQGFQDWTYDCITAGVDEALRIMKTDYLDIVHLHSCPIETLQYGEVINALHKAIESGKVRVAAYSGENEALEYSVQSGLFNSVQTSINIFDQKKLEKIIPSAKEKNIGVIGKRPLGNTPWIFSERPVNHYSEMYWERMKNMQLDFGDQWHETALRFSLFTEGVSSCITGTKSINHLKENVRHALKGPLSPDLYLQLRNKFIIHDDNWAGQV